MARHRRPGVLPLIVVTAYTDNGGYAEFVNPWIDSVRKHLNAHFLVVRYGEVQTWREAAHLKPWAILHALSTRNEHVVWIDIDAVVAKPFSVPEGTWDLAFRQYNRHSMTGTLFLRNSTAVHLFVEEWHNRSVGSKKDRNQLIFEEVLAESPNLETLLLPPGFTFVDYDSRDSSVPEKDRIIIHHLHAKTQRHR